MKKSVGIP